MEKILQSIPSLLNRNQLTKKRKLLNLERHSLHKLVEIPFKLNRHLLIVNKKSIVFTTQTQRHRDTETDTDTETQTHRHRETHTERHTHTERTTGLSGGLGSPKPKASRKTKKTKKNKVE